MNGFMRHYAREDLPDIGPGKYNVARSFKITKEKFQQCSPSISKKGYGGLARFGRRTPPTAAAASAASAAPAAPAPQITNFPADETTRPLSAAHPVIVSTMKYPFASTAKRKIQTRNDNPGPAMYEISIEPGKRGIRYEGSFGGKVTTKLGVEIKCCNRNNDVCQVCGEKPIGDYWHLNNRVFICRPCMLERGRELSKHHNRLQLEQFRKLRDCSGIHTHDGTDAKIWLMHPSEIKKWTRREAYLCAHFKH